MGWAPVYIEVNSHWDIPHALGHQPPFSPNQCSQCGHNNQQQLHVQWGTTRLWVVLKGQTVLTVCSVTRGHSVHILQTKTNQRTIRSFSIIVSMTSFATFQTKDLNSTSCISEPKSTGHDTSLLMFRVHLHIDAPTQQLPLKKLLRSS